MNSLDDFYKGVWQGLFLVAGIVVIFLILSINFSTGW